jgi:hypothetical protein
MKALLVGAFAAVALLLPVRASAQAQLIGTYTVSYLYNAGGCDGTNPNPYYCSYIAPGPIHIPAPSGRYRVVRTQVLNPDDAGGVRVWDGDATGGTQYNPGPGPVEFLHNFGEITLYYNDWYPFDNSPAIASVIEVYSISQCDDGLPTGEEFQAPPLSNYLSSMPLYAQYVGYGFTMKLLGGNFNGRQLQEVTVPGGSSNCRTFGHPRGPVLSDSTWLIGPDNLFTDHVGTLRAEVTTLSNLLAPGESCSSVVFQQMQMYCPSNGKWIDYGPVNRIEQQFFKDHVDTSRTPVRATQYSPYNK